MMRYAALPLAILVLWACDPELESGAAPGGLRPGSRVVVDGVVRTTTTATSALCAEPAFADVIVAGTTTVAVVCYPTQVNQVLRPAGGPSINLNAGQDRVAIDLSAVTNGVFNGDININSARDVSIFGSASQPTLIRGNLNFHEGDVRVFGVVVDGDVSFNRNDQSSALVDVTVLGNLNVHVENFVASRLSVFGDFNINRQASVLATASYGQNINIHGAPRFCADVAPFVDANGNRRVESSERGPGSGCPNLPPPPLGLSLSTFFDATGLNVSIQGGSGRYDFGMAETGSVFPGWLAEDCAGGVPGLDLCHRNVPSRFRLTTVTSSRSVVPGSSTLFDSFSAGGITFIVIDQGRCFTRGNDPRYYPTCQRI